LDVPKRAIDRVEALNHAAFLHHGAPLPLSLVSHIPAPLTSVRTAAANHGIDKLQTIIAMTYRLDSCCDATRIDNRGVVTA
jgi:hypothetical protein